MDKINISQLKKGNWFKFEGSDDLLFVTKPLYKQSSSYKKIGYYNMTKIIKGFRFIYNESVDSYKVIKLDVDIVIKGEDK